MHAVDLGKNDNFVLLQTLFMAFGNMLNLGAYFFLKYVIHRRDPSSLDGQAPPVTPLIMLPVIQGFY